MKSEFEIAITQLCSDRNLSPEVILEAIEAALVSAYKRNYGANQNVRVTVDPRTGQARVFVDKTAVQTVEDEHTEMPLAEARTYNPEAEVGDTISIELKPKNFGRIAAQTAKQVIMQRIREAERDSVYLEYADREGEIVNGVVRNVDGRTGNVQISLGKAEAMLPKSEQIPGESYRFNQRVRVYIVEVGRTGHGPQIAVSRTHHGLLRRLLELEVPEIFNGTVEIKAIAREAGSRSKIAVAALQPGVDPVGSCVGMRGVRIQNIVNELNGEKIDVVAWSPDIETFIANALSPAKVVTVYLNELDKTAKVVVPDKSLSLAIGKEGQNARLAAKLTGWRIDIRSETEAAAEKDRLAAEAQEAAMRAQELEDARKAAAELLAQAQVGLEDDEEELDAEQLRLEEERAYANEQSLATAAPEVAPETEIEAEAEAALDAEPEAELETISPEEQVAEVDLEPAEAIEEVETEAEELEIPSAELADVDQVAETEDHLSVTEERPDDEAVEEVSQNQEQEEGEEEAVETDEENLLESEDFESDDESEEGGRLSKDRRKKNRQRLLEYDERLGRVVARKKRKPSRRRSWDEEWE
ncbi:MAG: transcription termination/antitermination protein NusA [Chloroflexi bacterium]|jgi:N utilization substance protein A|nr:transcription termination/antitermination protein NusA [Chloroflexota bacterium]